MKLFGVQIDTLTRAEACVRLKNPQLIFTPNPEILLEAHKNPAFRDALGMGTLMLPDGHGLQFVTTLRRLPSRLLRLFFYVPSLLLFLLWKRPFTTVIPEVIHGSDFMTEVLAQAVLEKKSVFFLGGAPGVAEKAASRLMQLFPGLELAGCSSANPGEAAFKEVKKTGAGALFVAYGAPKQELWIAEYASKIPSLKWVMGVGGSLDFYAGVVPRAPKVLRRLGLEWLWRLLINPLQRMKRIWNAVVVFPFEAL